MLVSQLRSPDGTQWNPGHKVGLAPFAWIPLRSIQATVE
jgi:hypothetical protein